MRQESEANMDNLPILPFEKILSYLSLEDRIRSRAVSRSWCKTIDSFRVKHLCFSQGLVGFTYEKSRWVRGVFAQNFISSPRIESFVSTFGQTILSNLKHLRLCKLYIDEDDEPAFAKTLGSFDQLEELGLFDLQFTNDTLAELELRLPMLNSIHLKGIGGIRELTLNAPRLHKVKLVDYDPLWVKFVHAESVEKLLADLMEYTEVKSLKNLKYLYTGPHSIDSNLLSSLEQLEEIHLTNRAAVSNLFDLKRQYDRADLKIYLHGCLLNGPNDPAISSLSYPYEKPTIRFLAENLPRLADEIPFGDFLHYEVFDRVPLDMGINLVSRLTDLGSIRVDRPVQDPQRFLDFLRNVDKIVYLWFQCDQPQDLFDRLPEHCPQYLDIKCPVSDLAFLVKLQDLIYIRLNWSIDIEIIRKVLEQLEFLLKFEFKFLGKRVEIEIEYPKQFIVSVDGEDTEMADVNAVIQFIVESIK